MPSAVPPRLVWLEKENGRSAVQYFGFEENDQGKSKDARIPMLEKGFGLHYSAHAEQ